MAKWTEAGGITQPPSAVLSALNPLGHNGIFFITYPSTDGSLPVRTWAGSCLIYTHPMRSDRTPGNRAAYEAARQKILKTQTICGICGKPVDFSYRNPHPLSPTVDHIIPVSKGGHPSDISNLQLAHRCCNRQKSDSLIEPRKKESEEGDSPVPNDLLEQHFDWINYRPE